MPQRLRIRHSDLAGTSRLFSDFIYNTDRVLRWIGEDYRETESYRTTAERLVSCRWPRREISDILCEQNEAFGASKETLSNISRITDGDALFAITGQQVGMLGGPLLVLFKALTVIKLAASLSDALSHPVVPVFWMATDDHDFPEINHVNIPDTDGNLSRIEYRPETSVDGKAMSDVTLEGGVNQFIDEALGMLPDSEFKPPLERLMRSACTPGEKLGVSFAKFLLSYLGKYGLIVVDPSDKGLRAVASGIIEHEISAHESTRRIIGKTNDSLVDAGYHLQVRRNPDYLSVFHHTDKRSRVGFRDGRFFIEGLEENLTEEDLKSRLLTRPEDFSPSALLRPVVQSRLFPVVAFVAGPAEVAYYAQMYGLFSEFDVVAPVIYPRMSATLVESRWRRFIERSEIELPKLIGFEERDALLKSIISKRIPVELNDELSSLETEIDKKLSAIDSHLAGDQSMKRSFEQTGRKIKRELDLFRERLVRSQKRSDDEFTQKFMRCARHLFPEQSLQERHYSFLYFIDKYGPDVVDEIHRTLDLNENDHQVITL